MASKLSALLSDIVAQHSVFVNNLRAQGVSVEDSATYNELIAAVAEIEKNNK